MRRIKAVLVTTVVLVCVAAGIGALPAAAHAEVCPNAASRSGPSASLPDCRVFEMVSPLKNEDGDVCVPDPAEAPAAMRSPRLGRFRASSDGDAVAYVGDPSSGRQRRDRLGGWQQLPGHARFDRWLGARHDIQPPGITYAAYEAFSSDLSLGILRPLKSCPKRVCPKNWPATTSCTHAPPAMGPYIRSSPSSPRTGCRGQTGRWVNSGPPIRGWAGGTRSSLPARTPARARFQRSARSCSRRTTR